VIARAMQLFATLTPKQALAGGKHVIFKKAPAQSV